MKKRLLLFIVLLSSVMSFAQIAEYNFDNTYSNISGNTPFGYGSGTSFPAGRNGGTNKALRIEAYYTNPSVNISSLPVGGTSRTISLWYKVDNNATKPTIFYYGTASSGKYFGLSLSATGSPVFQGTGLGTGNDFGGNFSALTWQHVVVTYDQSSSTVKIYMNGALQNSLVIGLNTVGTQFYLISYDVGKTYDDLKIYDRALTDSEISNLYDYNTIVAPITKPSISFTSNPAATISATINYYINANNAATTSVIKYGLSDTSLTSQVAGISTTGKTYAVGNTVISGLLPNTQYFYQIEATNSAGTTAHQIRNFTTANNVVIPTVTNISAVSTLNSATVSCTVNPGEALTSPVLWYGTTGAGGAVNFSNQITGTSTTTTGPISFNVTGLTQNTTYYYKIEATNSVGMSGANFNFFITQSLAAIADYRFDNTANNVLGTNPFTLTSAVTYVLDRNSSPNKAINISNTAATGSNVVGLAGLPIGNSSRTISIWIRPTTVNSDNVIFTYGNGNLNEVYGGSFVPSKIYNFSYSSNLEYSTTVVANVWKHIVYTYEQSTGAATIYVDGAFASSSLQPDWNTTGNGVFYLGSLFTGGSSKYVGDIDDLKIFNRAISASEVSNLYTNNALSSPNFASTTPEISIYPNPVKDILHIETADEIKSVTVFGILGNQVLTTTSKEVNFSHLSKGTYIVKIQDANNVVTTKKIIKE